MHWFHIFRQIYNKYLPQISEKQLREAYVYGERYLATHRVIEPEDDFLAMLKKKIAIQASQLGVEDKGIISKLAVDCNNFVRAHMETTRRVLAALSKRFPMTLVSNFYGNIHTVLRSYGLNGYFKDVVESAIVYASPTHEFSPLVLRRSAYAPKR